jgi:hypothetical protein
VPHLQGDAQRIEILCNRFAAEFLVPTAAFNAAIQGREASEALAEELAAQVVNVKDPMNADYIPALAKVNSNIFGIALVTADGRIFAKGDVKSEVLQRIASRSASTTLPLPGKRSPQLLLQKNALSLSRRVSRSLMHGGRTNSVTTPISIRSPPLKLLFSLSHDEIIFSGPELPNTAASLNRPLAVPLPSADTSQWTKEDCRPAFGCLAEIWFMVSDRARDALEPVILGFQVQYDDFHRWLLARGIRRPRFWKKPSTKSKPRPEGVIPSQRIRHWYSAAWISSCEVDDRIPSRKQDWDAAKNALGKNVRRNQVEKARAEVAPEHWRHRGRRKRQPPN